MPPEKYLSSRAIGTEVVLRSGVDAMRNRKQPQFQGNHRNHLNIDNLDNEGNHGKVSNESCHKYT